MPFVKLDQGILDSTLWADRDAKDVFITALLLAEPTEFDNPIVELETRTIKETGFVAPAGWYGFIGSAGIGIVRRSGLQPGPGMEALERLAAGDPESRTAEWDGRRLIRMNGGFVVLNFMKYRDRDYNGAERAKKYRERQRELREGVTRDRHGRTRDSTQAEAEAEAEAEGNTKDFVLTPSGFDIPAPVRPGVARLLLTAGKVHEIYQEDVDAWAGAYPGVDVRAELRKIVVWLDANPSKRNASVSGSKRRVVTWLTSAQDKGGNRGSNQQYQNGNGSKTPSQRRVDQAIEALRESGVEIPDRRAEEGAAEVRAAEGRRDGSRPPGVVFEGSR